MKIVSFSARKYRSINSAYKLPLSQYSVLVGPNNEGKSNILKAIVICLVALSHTEIFRRRYTVGAYRNMEYFDQYDWNRDFPVSLRDKEPNGYSEFILEFELIDKEFSEFYEKVGSKLESNLKIKLSFGKDDAKIEILMKGKGKKLLNANKRTIVNYLQEKILIQYIPSIRPSDTAIAAVERILANELKQLEEKEEYKVVLQNLASLQKPILEQMSRQITKTISGFIPDVKEISLETEKFLSKAISNSCKIFVDDGVKTDLRLKGDGVISLTAISLIRHISELRKGNRHLVLAIEEPESHLHPKAIHGLRNVLNDIASFNQVIISTHSPIMVDKQSVARNIIVNHGKAKPAEKLYDIRKSLGIQMHDNLTNAYIVLLVEGAEDKELIALWLSEQFPIIKHAIENGIVAIDCLLGASHLCYKASFYQNNLSNIHAYLDHDKDGRDAIDIAKKEGMIDESDYTLSTCRGLKNSELEDLIEFSCYENSIKTDFAIDLNCKRFHNNKFKWTERIKDCFMTAGKKWDEQLEKKIKQTVCTIAKSQGLKSLNNHKKNSIDSLALSLQTKLQNLQ